MVWERGGKAEVGKGGLMIDCWGASGEGEGGAVNGGEEGSSNLMGYSKPLSRLPHPESAWKDVLMLS